MGEAVRHNRSDGNKATYSGCYPNLMPLASFREVDAIPIPHLTYINFTKTVCADSGEAAGRAHPGPGPIFTPQSVSKSSVVGDESD